MEAKNYITQLTKADLREIAAAANATVGFGIRIDKSQGALKISIDENALKIAIAAFIKNGGAAKTTVADICATPLTLPS